MLNGPATKDWYVRPGKFRSVSAVGVVVGGGVFFFDFWSTKQDVVFRYCFAGTGLTSSSISENGELFGEWAAMDPTIPFAPEQLHEAGGRMVMLKVGAVYTTCRISARKDGKQLFFGNKVQVLSTPGLPQTLFSNKGHLLVGSWAQVDAWTQKETRSENLGWPDENSGGNAMPVY